MSRIGKKPITIPESVQVAVDKLKATIESGDKKIILTIPEGIKVEVKKTQVLVTPKNSSRQTRALHGLTRSLLNNAIIGVTQGFSKTLELQGTGYRVAAIGDGLELKLGFSHPVVYTPPDQIKLEVKQDKFITVSGRDKQLVGQVAAEIRSHRPPDAYKGKGVRYQNEVVKLKPGKAAKAAGDETQT